MSQPRETRTTKCLTEKATTTNHSGDLCFDCAIPAEVWSNIDLGRAIMMVNGDEDYDADHVENYL